MEHEETAVYIALARHQKLNWYLLVDPHMMLCLECHSNSDIPAPTQKGKEKAGSHMS